MTKPEIPKHEGSPNDEARMTSTMPELSVSRDSAHEPFGLRASSFLASAQK